MSDKLLNAIIRKAETAINDAPCRINERDKLSIINLKVKMGKEEGKEILRILKETI